MPCSLIRSIVLIVHLRARAPEKILGQKRKRPARKLA
jgi:hypothetical protein